MAQKRSAVRCPVCGEMRSPSEMVNGQFVRGAVAALIQQEHPGWSTELPVCSTDLHHYRITHLESLLDTERGELSDLDREVIERIREGETLAENVVAEVERNLPFADRIADRVATFGGSWTFILSFFTVLVGWMLINTVVLLRRPFDPYPFILLNLVLSCIAAVQAPVIMMSQRRQELKDRARSEHDYQVNLKAELEVRLLHEKMDHLILHQWQRLLDIQQIQTAMLDELTSGRHVHPPKPPAG